MPLLFSEVATLLQRLEDLELHDPPLLPAHLSARVDKTIHGWFKSHRTSVQQLDAPAATAFLSTLFPERRTDRVYGIQAPKLCRLLSRSLELSSGRRKDLESYTRPGYGDLACSLYRLIHTGGCRASPPVTVTDVDRLLHSFAYLCRFSDPAILSGPAPSEPATSTLANIIKRCSAEEAKWLVRVILKDFSPVRLDERTVLQAYHFLLPNLLRLQNSFQAATALLTSNALKQLPQNPDPRSREFFYKAILPDLKPSVGVKVGRPSFWKARSMQNCLDYVGKHRWVLERKYDGEYCEVHVDTQMSPIPSKCIKIFSKSGKDSTADRKGVLDTIVDCLQLGQSTCKIQWQAILLGELVVYSDSPKGRGVMPFEKIRKHVHRSGQRLGADLDSPRHSNEHLAIVFFDLLLWDDEVVLNKPTDKRRSLLKQIYQKRPGRAFSSEWKIVDFAEADAEKRLVTQYAAAIANRCEGLILKPCDPYFSLGPSKPFIKLKKDYIQDCGDDADLAVVGASYDAKLSLARGVSHLKWTDFHVACLTNADAVQRFDARPVFRYVATIKDRTCIPKPILQSLNEVGQYSAQAHTTTDERRSYDILGLRVIRMQVFFTEPMVVEVLGSGFDKFSNCDYFMLRHPRIRKHHQDRSWKNTDSFQALQERAKLTREAPIQLDIEETRQWIKKLTNKSTRKSERESTSGTNTLGTDSPTRRCTSSASSPLNSFRSHPLPKRRLEASDENRDPKLPTSQLHVFSTVLVHDEDNTVVSFGSGLTRSRGHPLSEHSPNAKRQRCEISVTKDGETGSKGLDYRRRRAYQYLPTPAPTAEAQKANPTSYPLSSRPSTSASSSSITFCLSASGCLFADSVIHITPSVLQKRSKFAQLYNFHWNCAVTSCLTHWDRDSFSHPPLVSDTVAESQAYSGQRKLILVDSTEPSDLRATILALYKLNQGRFRERVDVFDCAVVEACQHHERSCHDPMIKGEYWIGATIFDHTREVMKFAPGAPKWAWLASTVG